MSKPRSNSSDEDGVDPKRNIDYGNMDTIMSLSPGEYTGGVLERPEEPSKKGTPSRESKENLQAEPDSDDFPSSPIYETESMPALNQALDPEDRVRSPKELQTLMNVEAEEKSLSNKGATKEKGKSEGGAPSSSRGKVQTPSSSPSTPASVSSQSEVQISERQ